MPKHSTREHRIPIKWCILRQHKPAGGCEFFALKVKSRRAKCYQNLITSRLHNNIFLRPTNLLQFLISSFLDTHTCMDVDSRLNLRKFVFGNRVIDHWNGLSDSCVNCSTINNFKSKIKVELEPEL